MAGTPSVIMNFVVAWLIFSVLVAFSFVIYGPLCKPDAELDLMG